VVGVCFLANAENDHWLPRKAAFSERFGLQARGQFGTTHRVSVGRGAHSDRSGFPDAESPNAHGSAAESLGSAATPGCQAGSLRQRR
jgi:hypothetical protein